MATRVLILKGAPLAAETEAEARGPSPAYKLLQLPNPSTGQQQQYILTASGLLEANRVKHAATSWLVGDFFISDGSAFLASPINVVYVLLALLRSTSNEAAGMFQEAESLLCCEEWPAAQQLLGLAAQQLPCICDVKALEDGCYYRLNNDKVLAYLRVCVLQALAAFQAHSPASMAGLPPLQQQAYVLGYLREYLSQAWHDKLLASYGLDARAFGDAAEGSLPATRPAAQAATPADAEKKQKVVDPKEAARKKAEESRAAASAAKMAKHAAGSKKISAFFTAKK
ncbi:ribonuclease H2, subunit B [Scenedesmus sp. NREL 46B-D3]|nr:ribonuclease H2, subunit B [Scenedesmus sp. NREL 46B-D3]